MLSSHFPPVILNHHITTFPAIQSKSNFTQYSTRIQTNEIPSKFLLREKSRINLKPAALPEGLKSDLIPRHVAVIMDGNRKWARRQGLPVSAGHTAGVKSLKKLVRLSARLGIRVLTIFLFSTENWTRSKDEVQHLMSLFEQLLKTQIKRLARCNIRVSVIGDLSKLPDSLKKLANDAEETTKKNSGLQLIVALSYSGKYDVLQACRNIARKAKGGHIQLKDIDEGLIEQELETNCTEFPNPDMLIRTSGELRISNFMLWQLAYTELFFVDSLWPDFGEDEFVAALIAFQQRNRRFGGQL